MSENDLFEWIQLNIIYASQHRKRELKKDNITFPKHEMIEKILFGKKNVFTDGHGRVHEIDGDLLRAKNAVHKRFLLEQAARTKEVIEELCMIKNVSELPDNCYQILRAIDCIDGGHDKRVQNAKWHISYFSDKDKEKIEKVMDSLKCRNYELHYGIEDCIKQFKFY